MPAFKLCGKTVGYQVLQVVKGREEIKKKYIGSGMAHVRHSTKSQDTRSERTSIGYQYMSMQWGGSSE